MVSLLKKWLSKILKSFFRLLPIKNVIIFESYPDFSDSSLQVYRELIRRGFDKKYKMLWLAENVDPRQECHTPKNKLERLKLRCTAKCIICGNRIVYKTREKQFSFYLTHGGPAKVTKDYYYFKGDVSYLVTIAPNCEGIIADSFHFTTDRTFGLGQPRVSEILNSKVNLKDVFGEFDKYIFWYPTFRNHKGGRLVGNGAPIPFETSLDEINEFARNLNILIIAKCHFAQKESGLSNLTFSNLIFVDFDYFECRNTTSYACLAKADALITDYSSVFYDYLVCDKPICFVWDDVDSYMKTNGLEDMFLYNSSSCGEKVYTVNQLLSFIRDVSNGQDIHRDARQRVFAEFYPFDAIDSTKRVTDFIIEKAGL